VHVLTKTHRYWQFDPGSMTSFERLRAEYEALLELHIKLAKSYLTNLSLSGIEGSERFLETAITTKIKDGFPEHITREAPQAHKTEAA
jgi:hypothetical protein